MQGSMDEMSDIEKAYYENLNIVIGNAEKTVLNLCSSSENCLIGDINNAMVDLDDMQSLESMVENGWFTASAALMHETYEQYEVQVGKISHSSAHRHACKREGDGSNV